MDKNTPPNTSEWLEYYRNTKDLPPRPLLVKALGFVTDKNKSIDIGGGGLRDARYLLHEGFDVTVIDKEPCLKEQAESLKNEHLHTFVTSYEDFNFGENRYDLASAMFSLPFNPPESFTRVFNNIKRSIVPGGIFCGQLFGINDEWASRPNMTFHAKDQVEKLLDDMDVIESIEKEEDGTTANGKRKHWHVFHVIAKRKYTGSLV